jgi:Calcium binding
MTQKRKDAAREQRILNEVVPDAHDDEERAMGWYSYLDDQLRFPFQARCMTQRGVSPLTKGEEVTVLGMSPESESLREMFVEIRWQGRSLAVPLAQLKDTHADAQTREAIEDWHYWIRMDYQL